MKPEEAWKWSSLMALVMDFGGGLVTVAIPMLAVSLGTSPSKVGIVGAVGPGTYALSCLLGHRWADRWGRQVSIRVGSLLVALNCILVSLLALQPFLIPLAIGSSLLGMSYALFWPATQASAGAGVSPLKLPSVLRWYNLSWSGGRMIGTSMAGSLFLVSPSLPFLVAGLASAVVFLLSKRPLSVLATGNFDHDGPTTPLPAALVTSGQLGNLVRSVAVMEVSVLFPKLAKGHGWSEDQISYLLGCLFLGHTIGFLLSPLIIKGVGWVLVEGCKIAMSVTTLLVPFVNSPFLLAVIFCLIGVSAALTTTVSLVLSIASQGESVQGSARHEAGVGAGGVGGPVVGGFLMERVSPASAFHLPIVLTIALFLWDWRAAARPRQVSQKMR